MPCRKAAFLIALVLCASVAAWPQTWRPRPHPIDPLSVRPSVRIAQSVDEQQRTVLRGGRHPLAQAQYEVGDLPKGQRMDRMVLVLRPDREQEDALAELIRAQQDIGSPYYHQWLIPKAFGERFGIAQADLDQVTNWLQAHGLEVDDVPPSRRTIVFSGTVASVEAAFHTTMRQYRVQGEPHYANAADPEIPLALAGVVSGVVSLHDFRSAPQLVGAQPDYTLPNGAHLLMPQDWDTIYDVSPLYGQGLDGTGQSIAVLGRVDVALSDVRAFRGNAGLPANDPQMIVNGADPGFPDCVDETEAALDVEWAGAIARNAKVLFVTSKSGTTDGINLSAQYAVNNNVAPIVTLSYGICEAGSASAGSEFWNGLWAQAVLQGMSVFISAGDSGAAGCDDPTLKTATQGRAVNAICSTPYTTCVGGTQFDDGYTPQLYWSATNGSGMSSVLSYIPESTWNESGWSGGLWATGGGASAIYSKPAWQTAPGVPADGMRDVPDVALHSSIQDAYVIQIQGKPFYVAGTSAATPSLASVMALVMQNTGTALGNVNPVLYGLANLQLSAGGAAVFHDIAKGNNGVPGVVGYGAGPGYDLATGLGSIDASVLVSHWSDASEWSFSLASSASNASVAPGGSSAVSLTEAAQGGFNVPVTLSVSGAPSGVSTAFSAQSLSASAPVTMTINAASNTAAGAYALTVSASGGGLTRTLPLALTVAAPTLTLTSAASSATASAGGSTGATLNTSVSGGFQSAVALSVSGLPAGVTAGFAPSSIASPGSGSSTLTLNVGNSAAAGVYGLTIIATGGGLTSMQQFSLTVMVPGLTLAASAAGATVSAGGSAAVTLTTAVSGGFQSAVALSVSGQPAGVTAGFARASIPSPGSGGSTLTLNVGGSAAAGVYNLTITATGGGLTSTQTFSLTVVMPGLSLTASAAGATVSAGGSAALMLTTAVSGGFLSAVALSLSSLPAGVTASFAPSSIASPGSGSSTLTLNVSSSAAAGVYNLTITASGGGLTRVQPFMLSVVVPSLTLTASATSATVLAGGSTAITLNTAVAGGFHSAVGLSVSGLPAGVTASFAPASIPSPGSGGSTLTLKVGSSAAAGVYNLTITASGGGLTRVQSFNLTVVVPSLTLTASAASATVQVGGSTAITLKTAAAGGFQSAVALSASGLPKGVTATFAPANMASPGSGTSALTLNVGSTVAGGGYTLTITAAGGGLTRTQPFKLTVTTPTLTLAASAASATVAAGGSTAISLSTAVGGGFQSAVALSVSGQPAGMTASFAPANIAPPGSGNSMLTLSAGGGVAAATYSLTITAAGGGLSSKQVLKLTVLPGLSLTLSGAKVVAAGGSIPISVSTTGTSGFKSAVTLSVSGLPAGMAAGFAPGSIAAPGTGHSTLTLKAASTAKAGTFTLIVMASGGGVTNSQPLSLTVTAH